MAGAEQRLADELEIRSLVARIAHEADTGAIDDYVDLYTEDGVFDMPDNPSVGLKGSKRRGRDEIRAGVEERRAAGLQGPGSQTLHVITTLSVDVDGSDEATSHCYFLYFGDTASSPALRTAGQYHDTYRRTPAGWKLAYRRVVMG